MDPAYHPPESVLANGIHLVYDSFGELTEPPVLLIGGLGDQLISWPEGLCQQLAGCGLRVIRFDNRDAGLSTRFDAYPVAGLFAQIWAFLRKKPLAIPYNLEDMAADAAGLLVALGVGPAHIVGASLGGMIAAMLAIHHPQQVKTLSILMSTAGYPIFAPPKPGSLILFKSPPPGRQAYIEHSVRVRRAVRGGGFPFDEAYVREKAGRMVDRSHLPAGSGRQMGAILDSIHRLRAGLPAIHVPTLVVHGRQDPLIPLKHGVYTARAIPGAKLVVIDGLGHELPTAAWPQVVDALRTHIS